MADKLSEVELRKWYRRSLKHFYLAGTIGFFLGLKIADWAFYKPENYQDISERMEDQYWKNWGQPTMIKPQLVESKVHPNTVRKSWIQIVYGKDNIVPKVPKQFQKQAERKAANKSRQ